MASYVYVDGDAVNTNLICCICHTPLLDPVLARPCRHTFCRGCIAQALEQAPRCPVDRAPLSADALGPADPIVRNMVEELLVHCAHAEAGCLHTSPRYLADAHADACEYAPARCAEPECGRTMSKRELEAHVCGSAVRCEGCVELVETSLLEEHSHTCPTHHSNNTEPANSLSVPCPHGCAWAGPHTALVAHTSSCTVGALRAENAALRRRTNALEDGLAALQAEMRAVRGALGPWAPRTEPPASVRLEARADELAGFFAGSAADGFYAVREPGVAPPPGPSTPFAPTPGAPFAAGVAPLDLGAPLVGTLAGLRASVVGVAAGALAQAADVGALRLALGGVRAQVHSLLADRNARVLGRALSDAGGERAGTKL